MGLMDKVKAQAEQAMKQAQAGVAQGQAKLDQVQAGRRRDELLRDLGAAVYAERRQGGSPAAVDTALQAVDSFDAEHGAGVGAAPPAPSATGEPGGPAPTTDASGTPPPAEGGFTL